MAFPSVTYVFSNGTTIDAGQFNQNFQDVLNGLSDGTKSINVAAGTFSGTVTLSGAIVFGSSSSNLITWNGSLASSIPLSATNSWDIGSDTFGLASIYLGSGSSAHSTRVKGAAVLSAYTLTLPLTGGSASYLPRTDGSGTLTFLPPPHGAVTNYGITATVAANALTINLKGADGNAPSSTNPVDAIFRNSTATTGTPTIASATAATSLVISSGSTLNHQSGKDGYVYIFLLNNSGTIELAASSSETWDEGSLQSTTAEGGGGGADGSVLYSTTLRTNVAIRLIGRLKSNQATAGTWASAISEISLWPFETNAPRSEVYVQQASGHGSVGTKIRTFTNIRSNKGSAITYASDSTNGDTFTVNEPGIYHVEYEDTGGVSAITAGVTVNASSLTTNIASLTYANGVRAVFNDSAGGITYVSTIVSIDTADLPAVFRAHDDGVSAQTGLQGQYFHIIKISK